MLKHKQLRDWLEPLVPGFATDPGRLQLFIDRGRVACNAAGTLSYEYRYTLTIVLTPFAGDLDELVVPLLAWIAVNQPDLLQRRNGSGMPEPFTLEAEVLDGDQVDLTIALDLTERVRVTGRDDGGYEAQPLPEPDLSDVFPGVDALLRRLYAGGVLAAETRDADWLAANPA